MHVTVQLAATGKSIPSELGVDYDEIKQVVADYLETDPVYWEEEDTMGVDIYALCVFWDTIKRKWIVKTMPSFLNVMSIDKTCFRMVDTWNVKLF